jgi:hypothetical protein
VVLSRLGRYEQPGPDLCVREPLSEQGKDLLLACRQPTDRDRARASNRTRSCAEGSEKSVGLIDEWGGTHSIEHRKRGTALVDGRPTVANLGKGLGELEGDHGGEQRPLIRMESRPRL